MNDEKRRKATLEVISFSALANVPIFYIILTFKESQRLCNKWKICLYYQIGEVCCMVNWLENRLWNLPICLLCHLEQCDCVFVCVSVCVCVCMWETREWQSRRKSRERKLAFSSHSHWCHWSDVISLDEGVCVCVCVWHIVIFHCWIPSTSIHWIPTLFQTCKHQK